VIHKQGHIGHCHWKPSRECMWMPLNVGYHQTRQQPIQSGVLTKEWLCVHWQFLKCHLSTYTSPSPPHVRLAGSSITMATCSMSEPSLCTSLPTPCLIMLTARAHLRLFTGNPCMQMASVMLVYCLSSKLPIIASSTSALVGVCVHFREGDVMLRDGGWGGHPMWRVANICKLYSEVLPSSAI
jgi:hypothetical protein